MECLKIISIEFPSSNKAFGNNIKHLSIKCPHSRKSIKAVNHLAHEKSYA